jgi:hypothetical protein
VFISVLLGRSEPKYLAVDECALGFRSSEIVGFVMLQKWLQNMGVQKPVAAATPLWRFQYTRQPIPVVAP